MECVTEIFKLGKDKIVIDCGILTSYSHIWNMRTEYYELNVEKNGRTSDIDQFWVWNQGAIKTLKNIPFALTVACSEQMR